MTDLRPSRPRGRLTAPLTPHLFAPTRARPLRAKRHVLEAEARVEPHRHPWAQLAFSATGVMRLTAGGEQSEGTYLVPPSRAVWIPPGVAHAITVVEHCELRTLYLHQPRGRCGPRAAIDAEAPGRESDWDRCRVLEVSELLRALVLALPTTADGGAVPTAAERRREQLLGELICAEIEAAAPVPLGVALPQDKRLRALCEAVLDTPTRHATLAGWARDAGASERTIARLFRDELGTSFLQWRQQVLLARALAMAARRRPMSEIAAELGYASPSAFSAMVRRSVGAPPSRFFASAAS